MSIRTDNIDDMGRIMKRASGGVNLSSESAVSGKNLTNQLPPIKTNDKWYMIQRIGIRFQELINFRNELMNKREFVKHIKELLELNDFKAIGFGAGSVSLVRGEEEIIIPYSKYPNQYVLPPTLTGRKCFSKVEDILEKYFILHKISYGRNTIYINSRRVEDIQRRTIEDAKDFSKVLPDLKEMIFMDILPFFENNKTLELVHSKINHLETSELSKFIISPVHPRIMVIKRLINACDWESYCKESIEIYKEQSEGKYKAVFEPIYKFLPDLFKELSRYNLS